MAYVAKPKSFEEERQYQVASSSGAAPSTATTGTKGASAPTPPSTSSGQYTGVRAYLNANKPGAAKLGDQVSGAIDKETGDATQALSAGQSQFNTKAQENTYSFDPTAFQKLIDTGATDETTSKYLSGTYGGPKTLADVGARAGIDKEVGEAQQKGQLTTSQGGRMELLRSLGTRPQETGVTRLNTALLGSDKGAAQKFQSAAQRATDLTGQVAGAEATAAQRAASALATNQGVRDQTLGGVGSYLDQSDKDIDSRLNNLKSASQQKDAAAREYLMQIGQGGGVSEAGAQAVGLTPAQAVALQQQAATGNSAAKAKLAEFYTPANIALLTRSNVITPTEAARLSALAQIVNRQGYTSAQANLSSMFDLSGAQNSLRTGTGIPAGGGTGGYGTTPAPGAGTGAGTGYGGQGGNGPDGGGNDRDNSGSGTGTGFGGIGLGGFSLDDNGVAVANTTGISSTVAGGIAGLIGGMLGIPGLSTIASTVNTSINNAANAAAAAQNSANQDTNAGINGSMEGVGPAATSGPNGTGGASANAGEAAAAAAASGGYSDAAVGAAAQAAADATRGGASAADAAAAGAAAAAAADGGFGGYGSLGGLDNSGQGVNNGNGATAADAAADGFGNTGGGGGGGGGGKIICTAMNDRMGLPYRENQIWVRYSQTRLTPAHQKGYHKVFLPLVKYAFHTELPGHTILRSALEWMAITRTRDITEELNTRNPRPVIRAIRKMSEALLKFIGTHKD